MNSTPTANANTRRPSPWPSVSPAAPPNGCAICQGTLQPSNKTTRQLFTALTGIELPRTVAVIETEYADELAERTRLLEIAKEEKRAAQAARELEALDKICQRLREGSDVAGIELVDVARHLGIRDLPC